MEYLTIFEMIDQANKRIKQLGGVEMRGGKRKGAGRKPRQTARKQVNLRLEPETKDKLDRICEAEDISQTEIVTRWVDAYAI